MPRRLILGDSDTVFLAGSSIAFKLPPETLEEIFECNIQRLKCYSSTYPFYLDLPMYPPSVNLSSIGWGFGSSCPQLSIQRFADKNFQRVIRTAIYNIDPSLLILQATSVDLENCFREHGDDLQRLYSVGRKSSDNILWIAEESLRISQKLQHVIIAEKIQRTTTINLRLATDWTNTYLANAATTLVSADKISVHRHRLNPYGRESLFGPQEGKNWDGWHLRGIHGTSAYINSWKGIFENYEVIKRV